MIMYAAFWSLFQNKERLGDRPAGVETVAREGLASLISCLGVATRFALPLGRVPPEALPAPLPLGRPLPLPRPRPFFSSTSWLATESLLSESDSSSAELTAAALTSSSSTASVCVNLLRTGSLWVGESHEVWAEMMIPQQPCSLKSLALEGRRGEGPGLDEATVICNSTSCA